MNKYKIIYETWKQVVQTNNFNTYYIRESDDVVTLWTGNNQHMYECIGDSEWYSDWTGSFSASATQVSSSQDAQALIIGMSVPEKQRIQVDPRHGSAYQTYSVNWCKKETWYYTSEQIVNEVLNHSSGNTHYTRSVPDYIVDVSHGKITGEVHLRTQYAVQVALSGAATGIETVTENSPDLQDNDYDFDYASGGVIFNSPINPTASVIIQSAYEVKNSKWIIEPIEGKRLELLAVEVQFSDDVGIEDTAVYMPYGYVDVYAPQYSPVPYPTGTVIPLTTEARHYQTMDDYINESQRSFPVMPKLGGDGWRGMRTKQYIYRWPYNEEAARILYSSRGNKLEIYLQNDIPFSGSKAVAAVYAISNDE